MESEDAAASPKGAAHLEQHPQRRKSPRCSESEGWSLRLQAGAAAAADEAAQARKNAARAKDDLDAAREAIYGMQRQMAAVDDASNEARPATPPRPLWGAPATIGCASATRRIVMSTDTALPVSILMTGSDC